MCQDGIRDAQVDGAGVTMIAGSGLRLPVWASDDVSTTVEDLQVTLGQGPCLDASATSAPVLVHDLADFAPSAERAWPVFRDEALRAGVRAIFAFPLVFDSVQMGCLDLYRRTPGPLSQVQLSRGLSAAHKLGETLVDSTSLADERLGSQMAVHRAAGMVTVQLDCGIDEALARLRGTAYAEGVTVHQIAAEVEEGCRRFLREQT
jgi:hypothetical protein